MPVAPPIYSPLRRRLGVSAAALVIAGLFRILQVSGRVVTTLVIQVPVTTHLLPAPSAAPAASPGAIAHATLAAAPSRARVAAIANPLSRPAPQPSPPPPPDPRPPLPGTYDYRYTVDGSQRSGTIMVGAPRAAGGNTEQSEVERVAGMTRRRSLVWSSAWVAITASDYGTGSCRWSPALPVYRLPFTSGERWSARSSCPFTTSDGVSAEMTEDEQARVDGYVTTTVGGQRARCWVVERHSTLTERVRGMTMSTESQSTELFAPAFGLVVWEDGRTARPNPDGTTTTTTTTMALQALRSR